jgi:hypothetical protein
VWGDAQAREKLLQRVSLADCRDADRRDPPMASTAIQSVGYEHRDLRGFLGRERAGTDLREYRATYGLDSVSARL